MPGAEQKGSFLGAISPWNISRSTTPQPGTADHVDRKDGLQRSQGEDHTVTRRHRPSPRDYPKDCPPLRVRWFYAVDTPKSKPVFADQKKDSSKPLPPPKKFVPFSFKDSQSIEAAFQQLADEENASDAAGCKHNVRATEQDSVKVPVNEDFLFDVDVKRRELSPAYWLGPVYEVRRGTWFFQEGSTLKPCEENLATQLEEGFLKVKPWRLHDQQKSKSRPPSTSITSESGKSTDNSSWLPGTSQLRAADSSYNAEHVAADSASTPVNEPQSYRLFGAYMNCTVTYHDSSTAWLTYDDFMSRMSSTVYQRFGGVPGTKVVRGFTEVKRPKETTETRGTDLKSHGQGKPREGFSVGVSERDSAKPKRKSAPDSLSAFTPGDQVSQIENATEEQHRTFEKMSSLTGEQRDTAEIEEAARRQEEKEMEDSSEADGEERGREIDHLVLVTHGIGQRLGLRLESMNFVHDVNVLRKTMKSVYAASPDLQALNSSFADSSKNCRVQVLPVCWRHLLDFPMQKIRQSRRELDLADADNLAAEDDQYPSLADITLEGVPAVRNLISDLAMDVLLYQSAYREHIAAIVQQECNRIYNLFKKRNPSFRGSVSLCGHSLGSAILFDILCQQPSNPASAQRTGTTTRNKSDTQSREVGSFPLDFECEEFFCLGSPIALFQMLKGKTIAGRSIVGAESIQNPLDFDGEHQSFIGTPASADRPTNVASGRAFDCVPPTVSSPKCAQLYNIFHPSDPVSYRLEPLISPAMAALKPQPLPSVKKSIWTASGQSLSNISTRVGQSVGSLWTNFTSGVASSLLNRSLGLSAEDTPSQASSSSSVSHSQQTKVTANSEPSSNGRDHSSSKEVNSRKDEENSQTLIDTELETLFEGFRKKRTSQRRGASEASENALEWLEAEERAKKIKNEEAKVRALNSNGRVDYSVQEGAFDISLIASIASHLSYWADEDVNHFMLSQMLSRTRRRRRRG